MWSRLSKSNMDIQFLINGEGRNVTCYTLKYTFKPQKIESTVIMKMSLLTKSVGRVISKDDNAEISDIERGRRIINSVLYTFTKPVEVPATIAALAIIRGSIFLMSHDPVYLNLAAAAATYSDRNVTIVTKDIGHTLTPTKRKYRSIEMVENGDDNNKDSTDEDSDCDSTCQEYIKYLSQKRQSEASTGIYKSDDENDEETVVQVTIDKRTLVTALSSDDVINECEKFIDFNVMNDYWYRPKSMHSLSYIDVMEQYHLELGEGPHYSKMCLGHPNPSRRHWKINKNFIRKCSVVSGMQLPNLISTVCKSEDREFYFKSLIILFKPHNSMEDIITGYSGIYTGHICYEY